MRAWVSACILKHWMGEMSKTDLKCELCDGARLKLCLVSSCFCEN